jgi:hypothetical protein
LILKRFQRRKSGAAEAILSSLLVLVAFTDTPIAV